MPDNKFPMHEFPAEVCDISDPLIDYPYFLSTSKSKHTLS